MTARGAHGYGRIVSSINYVANHAAGITHTHIPYNMFDRSTVRRIHIYYTHAPRHTHSNLRGAYYRYEKVCVVLAYTHTDRTACARHSRIDRSYVHIVRHPRASTRNWISNPHVRVRAHATAIAFNPRPIRLVGFADACAPCAHVPNSTAENMSTPYSLICNRVLD